MQERQAEVSETEKEEAERQRRLDEAERLRKAQAIADRNRVKRECAFEFVCISKRDRDREREEDERLADPAAGRLSTVDSITKLITPGAIYRAKFQGGDEIDVHFKKDGTAMPVFGRNLFGGDTALTMAQWSKGYGAAMDLLSQGTGAQTMHIDIEYPTGEYVKELMHLAALRNLTVEFGPKIEEFLNKLDKEDRKAYYDAKMAMDKNVAARNLLELPDLENRAFDRYNQNLSSQPPLNIGRLYKNQDNTDITTNDKKIEKLEEAVESLNNYANTYRKSSSELEGKLKAYHGQINDTRGLVNDEGKKESSLFQSIKKGMAKFFGDRILDELVDDSDLPKGSKLMDRIEQGMTASQANRNNLVTTLTAAPTELERRCAELKAKLTELRNNNNPTDEEKKKIEKMEKDIKSVEEMVAKQKPKVEQVKQSNDNLLGLCANAKQHVAAREERLQQQRPT